MFTTSSPLCLHQLVTTSSSLWRNWRIGRYNSWICDFTLRKACARSTTTKKKNMILSKTSCYSKAVKAGVVKSLIRDALDRSCINFISKLLEGQWKRLGAKQFGVETPNCFRLRRVTPFETGAHECTKAHCEKLIPCENSVVYEISMTWVLRM